MYYVKMQGKIFVSANILSPSGGVCSFHILFWNSGEYLIQIMARETATLEGNVLLPKKVINGRHSAKSTINPPFFKVKRKGSHRGQVIKALKRAEKGEIHVCN
jgi:hypothetical protein